MHAVPVFQHVGGIETVFSTRAGDDAVVPTVVATEAVAKLDQLPLPFLPVDFLFPPRHVAGIADAVLVETNGFLPALLIVREFDRGVRSLVRNDTGGAELDLARQPVSGLRRRFGALERCVLDVVAANEGVHGGLFLWGDRFRLVRCGRVSPASAAVRDGSPHPACRSRLSDSTTVSGPFGGRPMSARMVSYGSRFDRSTRPAKSSQR